MLPFFQHLPTGCFGAVANTVAAALLLSSLVGTDAGAQTETDGARPLVPVDKQRPTSHWGSGVSSPSARARLQRHMAYMVDGVPAPYRGEKRPDPSPAGEIDRGRALYRDRCAACHSMDGGGGGDAAADLSMPPALLKYMVKRPEAADEYLLWTISEGGRPFRTPMPAFKGVLKRDEIWAIVAFMRAGFPPATGDGGAGESRK